MSNPTTPFNWQMPTATDLVTDLPADFEVFGQAVATSLADLNGGTTGQVLAKATNTDLDFSWVTPELGDITAVNAGTGISGGGTTGAVTITNSMATAITTNGDLIYGTGSGTFNRLGIGTTGQILNVSGGIPAWAAAPSSGGMTLISTTTMSGSSVTLSSIPSTYTNLYVEIYDARWNTGGQDLRLTTNSFGTDGAQSGTYGNSPLSGSLLTSWNMSGENANQSNGFYSGVTIYGYNNARNLASWQTLYYIGTAYKAANYGGGKFGSAITSITISGSSSYSFTNGTIKLYGVK